MLQDNKYVNDSLELHLFFARIMKEHSFFLQISFTPKDTDLMYQADSFRKEFDKLLADAISLSNGVVSDDVLQSGELVTPYTVDAEKASTFYTGVKIPTKLTESVEELGTGTLMMPNHILVQRVYYLNEKAMSLVSDLIAFKTYLLNEVLNCSLFTSSYPLLIDHVLREAKLYFDFIRRLQSRQDMDIKHEAFEQEVFWNNIMGEHAKFIRGLLDPSENDLINTANNFGNEFENLTQEAQEANEETIPLKQLTEDSLRATQEIREFKKAGTEGILECKIKSIIIPLLGDHTLREANHYLRLLNMFKNI